MTDPKHPITAELREALAKIELPKTPQKCEEESPNSQRITVTGIDSKLPGPGKVLSGVLQTLPDKQRAPVVKFGLLVAGIIVGLVAGWAVARGYHF